MHLNHQASYNHSPFSSSRRSREVDIDDHEWMWRQRRTYSCLTCRGTCSKKDCRIWLHVRILDRVDFPPGSDMVGTIQQGPRAEQTELLCRLHGLYNLPSCGLVIYSQWKCTAQKTTNHDNPEMTLHTPPYRVLRRCLIGHRPVSSWSLIPYCQISQW